MLLEESPPPLPGGPGTEGKEEGGFVIPEGTSGNLMSQSSESEEEGT